MEGTVASAEGFAEGQLSHHVRGSSRKLAEATKIQKALSTQERLLWFSKRGLEFGVHSLMSPT